MKDSLGLKESVGIKRSKPSLTEVKEHLKWWAKWTIRRFRSDADLKANKPCSVSEFEGNVALNEGLQELIDIAIGAGGTTLYDNTNTRLGVGNDGVTAEDATQTGLQGATTAFKGMDATYPQRTNQDMIFRSTFGGTEGNQDWKEFTVDNGNTRNKNLNRKISDQGTKTSGQSWELTLTITFS